MIRLGIDIGGTFTDGVIVEQKTGSIKHAKSASTPKDPIQGLVKVLDRLAVGVDTAEIFVHGTTLVTNLILQRTGCTVGLLTTRGFRDVLEIQRSYRPDPLDVLWIKPEPLVPRDLRAEVDERTLADGSLDSSPERVDVLTQVRILIDRGAEALAVCFLNSYANPANELLVADWIRTELPEMPVSLSSDVDPQIREYERTSTTVLNAYAIPEVRAYIQALSDAVRPDVLLMHSGGGVLPAASVAERPVKLVQSGPAGGVIAAREIGRRITYENLITFDMGGTSTDVSVIVDGQIERAAETEITWGIPLRAESLEIRSIGAGGGSIALRDAGGVLKVGPRSAGAHPGPACYGVGGAEPTVTDANLVLNLIHPERFLGGDMSLDAGAALQAMTRLGVEFGVSTEDAAIGIHKMVNANMAQLIREMTVNKGRDPRDFALISFGGAGGQHAYGVAQTVGCNEVLFPRHAGAFSALGLVLADVQTTEAQSILLALGSLDFSEIEKAYLQLEDRARRNFLLRDEVTVRSVRHALVRYVGQTHEVMVNVMANDDESSLYDRFQATHEALFGTQLDDPAEVVSLHVTLSLEGSGQDTDTTGPSDPVEDPRAIEDRWLPLFGREAAVYMGATFAPDAQIVGPALIEERDTVVVVPPGATLSYEWLGDVYVLRLRESGMPDA